MYLLPPPAIPAIQRVGRRNRRPGLAADSDVVDLSTIDLRTGAPLGVPMNPITGCPIGVVGCKPLQQVATTDTQLPSTLTPPDFSLPPLINVSPAPAQAVSASAATATSWWEQTPFGVPNSYLVAGTGGFVLLLLLLRRH
jgi:hypothetical protein